MNVVKEIQRINEAEMGAGFSEGSSWHAQYKDSSWVFVSNLDYELTEGDVICIFSQYGELMNIELVRDQKTGKSRGFGFLQYEDQRSTILAVDNLNGSKVLERTLRVDHSHGPRKRMKQGDDESDDETRERRNIAPPTMEVTVEPESVKQSANSAELDEEDPMAEYIANKKRKKLEKKLEKKSNKRKKHHSDGRQ